MSVTVDNTGRVRVVVSPRPSVVVTVGRGLPGPSAYQVAVSTGFVGDVNAWLASLGSAVTPAESAASGRAIQLWGLDNGAGLPGAVLQARIDALIADGVPEYAIIWYSIGTQAATLEGVGTLTGVAAVSSVGTIGGAGIAIGAGAMVGVSAVTSVAAISGVGVAAGDSTPDTFTLTDQAGVASSTLIESNTITVAGIDVATAISVSGGEYSKNGGAYTSGAGTVVNGDTVKVRQTSSAAGGTETNCTLTIGGVSDTFSVTTNIDTTPAVFTFVDQTGVALSSVITSAGIAISDINSPAAISIAGGEYSVNGGVYTSVPGTVSNGDTVTVRLTSSSSNSTAASATLTIGGVSDTFTATTAAAGDTTPDAYSFMDQTDVPLSTVVESNTITVSGIDAPANLSVSAGGEYSKNGGAWASANTTVVNGDTIKVRRTSSATAGTTANVVVLIGGVGDTFSVTTLAAPTAPVITVTAGDTTNVIALTSGGTGATSYNLKWDTVSHSVDKAYSNTITGVTLPYTHTGRTNGTAYYYSLVAINGAGSVESDEVSGTPSAGAYYTQGWEGAANGATSYDGWTSGVSGVAAAHVSNLFSSVGSKSFALSVGDGESEGTAWVERTMSIRAGILTFSHKIDTGSPEPAYLKIYLDDVQVGPVGGYFGDGFGITLNIPSASKIRFSVTSLGGAIHIDALSIPIP